MTAVLCPLPILSSAHAAACQLAGGLPFDRRAVRRLGLCFAKRASTRVAHRLGLWTILFIAGMAGASRLVAEDGPTRAVMVTDADGRVHSGLLTEIDAGQVFLGSIEQVRLRTKDQVSLKIKDRTSTFHPTDPLVILAGGDILAVRPETSDEESLTARWARFPTWPAVKLPLESVRGALFNLPANAAAATRLFNQVLDYRESQDTVVLKNGDALAGEFAGLDDKHLFLQTAQGRSPIDPTGVRSVIFNPTLTTGESLKGEGALVALVDGTRFRAHDLRFGGLDRLTMRTLFGVDLDIPLSAVESLRFLGGCATYLSDLAPIEYKFEPFLDLEWPLRRDQSVAGGFLTLRGVQYPKGLGVHSRSSVTYRLDGKYRRFQATIGIDDETAGKGSVVFEVLLDGMSAFKSSPLTGTSAPVAIERLNLAGARLMTLRVDYAASGDIQDHADWCDAVLLK